MFEDEPRVLWTFQSSISEHSSNFSQDLAPGIGGRMPQVWKVEIKIDTQPVTSYQVHCVRFNQKCKGIVCSRSRYRQTLLKQSLELHKTHNQCAEQQNISNGGSDRWSHEICS